MRAWVRRLLAALLYRLQPKPDLEAENRFLKDAVSKIVGNTLEEQRRADFYERVSELIEARQMAGSGPWRVSAKTLADTDRLITAASNRIQNAGMPLRESTMPMLDAGATGDIELALQNVEWRREINLSWLEFSRWGIQQIILISRLHYIKNPWIQRAINIVSAYIFGRGVEVMSEDDTANDVLKDFFQRNKKVFGQKALTNHQRALQYDGQVFFAFFADKTSSGKVMARTIDATEIQEIITDPDDTDQPWFYHRVWSVKIFDPKGGGYNAVQSDEAYYPALDWVPTAEQKAEYAAQGDQINQHPIKWDIPVIQLKGGTGIAKWHFDCPKAYAALDWAKAGRRWLEACATVRTALSNIAMTLTTKGGQQALEGAKQQLGTTVGPTTNLWDQNPPPVTGAIFASGPGTTLAAFNTKGAGGDPSDVKEYRAMVGQVFEIPPTWLGDLETANLSTALTLDRPTELGMLEKQEAWREFLLCVATFVLNVDQNAPSGSLREAGKHEYRIVESPRRMLANGRSVYLKISEAQKKKKKDLELKVNFPAIREGDLPMMVKAIAEAMTLDNKGGQVVGIDEKVGVGLLYEQFGVEDYGDILDEMYPDSEYDPDRTKQVLPQPIGKALPTAGVPQVNPNQPQNQTPADKPVPSVESAAKRLIEAAKRIKEKEHASTQ